MGWLAAQGAIMVIGLFVVFLLGDRTTFRAFQSKVLMEIMCIDQPHYIEEMQKLPMLLQ